MFSLQKDQHFKKYYRYRSEVQCKVWKMFGYIDKVCKNKGEQSSQQQAQVVEVQ